MLGEQITLSNFTREEVPFLKEIMLTSVFLCLFYIKKLLCNKPIDHRKNKCFY